MVDLLGALKRLVEWQRVVAAAEKVPELERRIALLEAKISGAPQFVACPSCAVGRWRKVSSKPNADLGDHGVIDVTWGCDACTYTEVKTET